MITIVSRVHQVPIANIFGRTIIEVGESEAVGVFVADGAKGRLNSSSLYNLLHTAVAVDDIRLVATVDGTVAAISLTWLVRVFRMKGKPPLVGPDGVGIVTGVHALAGIDDDYLVDIAIAVPVVLAPVDVQRLQGVDNSVDHILRILVVGCRAAVPLNRVGHVDLDKVERQIELAIALGIEVVVNRALERTLA